MKQIDTVVLAGALVRLEPLRVAHAPGEDGRLRDSAMFSVTETEWPAVKSALATRVAAGGRTAPALS